MTILMIVMTEAILVMVAEEEKEGIMMMTVVQEEVEITTNPERGSEAEVEAVILDQEGADPETEDQEPLLQYQRCQLWIPNSTSGPVTPPSFAIG